MTLLRKIDDLILPGPVLFHFFEEEPGYDIETAEAAADMPGSGISDHVEGIDAADGCK